VIPVGLGITVLGYSIFYYGVTQIKGGNWGYLDLVLPNRWTVNVANSARDGQTQTTTTGSNKPRPISKNTQSILTTLGTLIP